MLSNLVCAFLLATAVSQPASTPVYPLTTVDPEAPLTDLAVFGEMVGDARIVALGEATHGTHEIFRMKHRLLRYLVEEKGFEIFSIEASMPESYAVDAYVQGQGGDPESLIGDMYFWTWHTREVRDMVVWMQEHNAAGGSIHFTGFDMQFPYEAARTVWEMAGGLDADWGQSLKARYRDIENVEDLLAIAGEIDARRTELAGRYSANEMAWLRQCVTLVEQGLLRPADPATGWSHRDRSMAENIAWIIEQNPESRIVLWAHNLHVARETGWMGAYLAERFGEDYLPVGFALGEGRYRAVHLGSGRLRAASLQRPPSSSVEAQLADAGHELAVVDLRQVTRDGASWPREERPMRNIGAGIMRQQFRPARAGELYDLLIYIERSSPSDMLPDPIQRARTL